MKVGFLVPVKEFSRGKSRLVQVFPPGARENARQLLCRGMLLHVLEMVKEAWKLRLGHEDSTTGGQRRWPAGGGGRSSLPRPGQASKSRSGGEDRFEIVVCSVPAGIVDDFAANDGGVNVHVIPEPGGDGGGEMDGPDQVRASSPPSSLPPSSPSSLPSPSSSPSSSSSPPHSHSPQTPPAPRDRDRLDLAIDAMNEHATRVLGVDATVLLMPDLPLLDAATIAGIVDLLDPAVTGCPGPRVVLSPATGNGCNMIGRHPPGIMETIYGHGSKPSFIAHVDRAREIARQLGMAPGEFIKVVPALDLYLDLDTPGDLVNIYPLLKELRPGSVVTRLLESLGCEIKKGTGDDNRLLELHTWKNT